MCLPKIPNLIVWRNHRSWDNLLKNRQIVYVTVTGRFGQVVYALKHLSKFSLESSRWDNLNNYRIHFGAKIKQNLNTSFIRTSECSLYLIFSSPEQGSGWAIVITFRPLSAVRFPPSVRRPSTPLNDFSETPGLVFFNLYVERSVDGGLKNCTYGHGPLIKMAAMPIYGKNT